MEQHIKKIEVLKLFHFLQRYNIGEGQGNGKLCTTQAISDILRCHLLQQQTNIYYRSSNVFENAVAYVEAIYQENGNLESDKDMIEKVRDWGVLHGISLIY